MKGKGLKGNDDKTRRREDTKENGERKKNGKEIIRIN